MSYIDVMRMTDDELESSLQWHTKRRKELFEKMSGMLADEQKDNGEFKLLMDEQNQIVEEEKLIRDTMEKRKQYK